jgi:integrase
MFFKFITERMKEGAELDKVRLNATMHKILDWEIGYRELMIADVYCGRDVEYIASDLREHAKEYSNRIYTANEIDGSSVFDSWYCAVDDKKRKSKDLKKQVVMSVANEIGCNKELASDVFDTFEDEFRTNESDVDSNVFAARGFFDRVSSLALKHTANKIDGEFDIQEAQRELNRYFPLSAPTESSFHESVPLKDGDVLHVLSIGEAVEQHIDKLNSSKGRKNNKHGAKFKAHGLKEMALIIGRDTPISSITVDMVDNYVDKLKHIPIRLDIDNIDFDINDFGITQIESDNLSLDTISKRLSDARRFINWLKGNRYIDKDHADLLKQNINNGITECEDQIEKMGGSQTRAYSIEELSKLFTVEVYLKWSRTRAYKFWGPLIALFTGMRMGEIMTLRRKDIKCTPALLDYHIQRKIKWREEPIGGLYYFDLTSTIEKDFKDSGKSSHRPIPVHPFLIEIGLLDFISRFKGDEFIFRDGLMINVGYENDYPRQFQNKYKLSDRFTTHRRRCGVGRMAKERSGDILTFHCFRNTVITQMRDCYVNPEVRCEIVGHGDGEVVANKDHKGYCDKFSIEQKLNDGIMKLDFHEKIPGLKLLAQSKWAKGGLKKRR